jgi:PAT family beta-lactamase induction signal transducer AmpG
VSPQQPSPGLLDVFRTKRMAVLFLLGFSGGLPLYLTSQTLQAWMSSIGLDLGAIADLSAVGLAYTLKFLWAPLIDRYQLPLLGRRRGWLLVLQLAVAIAIVLLGAVDPLAHPLELAALAVVVAVLSASLDVVIDAYKADILAPDERAAGSAAYVLGYRLGMLMAGTVALVMADHMSWSIVYAAMAALMIIGVIATLVADEPTLRDTPPRTLGEALVRPFREFIERLGIKRLAIVLAFAALYRFGDYFVQAVIITFLEREADFGLTTIGLVNKGLGVAGLAIGGLFAGSLVARFGLRRTLVAFGLLQAITNLLYSWLALDHDLAIFCIAVFVDHLSMALGTTALLAVLMGMTSPAVSATQFALLTSLTSVGQRLFGPLADDVVHATSWPAFFALSAAFAIPGLILAAWVARNFAPSRGAS